LRDGAASMEVTGTKSLASLTPRQLEVLDLLSQGLSNKMIGRRLSLSEHTVRGHVQATLAALSASSRSEAVFVARRQGIIL
ncbi:MAG: response regulator transcription factor, partial [Acidovorax sp.]